MSKIIKSIKNIFKTNEPSLMNKKKKDKKYLKKFQKKYSQKNIFLNVESIKKSIKEEKLNPFNYKFIELIRNLYSSELIDFTDFADIPFYKNAIKRSKYNIQLEIEIIFLSELKNNMLQESDNITIDKFYTNKFMKQIKNIDNYNYIELCKTILKLNKEKNEDEEKTEGFIKNKEAIHKKYIQSEKWDNFTWELLASVYHPSRINYFIPNETLELFDTTLI